MISSQSSAKGTSIEMVDLKAQRVKTEFVMKEFQPAGKVNYSQKKREKRKKQKQDQDVQAKAEAKKMYETAQDRYYAENEKSKDGKILKKKVLPKKTIVDEEGSWEVVDQKHTVLVEETASDQNSELSFE